MRVCGVIAEYDPFHNGHLYHLQAARKASQADYLVVVLGCAFSQRGSPMLFESHDRAKMALACGADLVLGLPISFSCAQANRFAKGGIGILTKLGLISDLSFGTESNSLQALQDTLELLENPGPNEQAALKAGLKLGQSLARARAASLERCQGINPQLMKSPNYILGLCYLAELRRRKSPIRPHPIQREGNYHALSLEAMPSASALRAAILRGDWQALRRHVPPASYEIIRQAALKGQIHKPESLDPALLYALNHLKREELAILPEYSEGLEGHILKGLREATGRESLLKLLQTKRYPRTRLNRALSQALLAPLEFEEDALFARILGFRAEARPLLKALKESSEIPLILKPSQSQIPSLQDSMRAEELWALGAGLPFETAWRRPCAILP